MSSTVDEDRMGGGNHPPLHAGPTNEMPNGDSWLPLYVKRWKKKKDSSLVGKRFSNSSVLQNLRGKLFVTYK